eukprot:Mrub_06064.p2 GENE.Mrub_06064~~Mrub_06064.p2  ORF type:complete len:173 (-),score=29.19 Mrub_06064:230-748(-)
MKTFVLKFDPIYNIKIKNKNYEKTTIFVNGENLLKFLKYKGGVLIQMDLYINQYQNLKESMRKTALSAMNSGKILCIDYVSPIRDQLPGLKELDSEDYFPLKNIMTKGWLWNKYDPKIAMIRPDDKLNHDDSPLHVREYGVAIITDLKTEEEAKKYFDSRFDINMVDFIVIK